ncbi:MAG: 4Fe-4S binding protein [Bacteroidales bacterium]|nr:4Fe-4S binding protein [Bacteroidales bacterium]
MIICFSGTGNTARAARLLGALLGETDVRMLAGEELLNPCSSTVDTADARVIWAFPTYSWGVPPVVARYISEVQAGAGLAKARHYMLTTCGDDMGYTDRQWRRLIGSRGWTAAAAYAVIMPNTYVTMNGFDVDTPELSQRKLADAAPKIKEIAALIAADSAADVTVRGAFPWVKSKVIYPWFVRFEMSPRPFHSTEDCIGCGLCERSCPMCNIRLSHGRPEWGGECALCLRCYHICPRRAVAYGRTTNGKGQWQGSLKFIE